VGLVLGLIIAWNSLLGDLPLIVWIVGLVVVALVLNWTFGRLHERVSNR
jgi:hypothetical protein